MAVALSAAHAVGAAARPRARLRRSRARRSTPCGGCGPRASRWPTSTRPFPLHGMDEALGLRPTRLALRHARRRARGRVGSSSSRRWVHVVDWPMNIGGKPDTRAARAGAGHLRADRARGRLRDARGALRSAAALPAPRARAGAARSRTRGSPTTGSSSSSSSATAASRPSASGRCARRSVRCEVVEDWRVAREARGGRRSSRLAGARSPAAGRRARSPASSCCPRCSTRVPYDAYDRNPVTASGQTLLLPPEGTVPLASAAFPYGPGPEEARAGGPRAAEPARADAGEPRARPAGVRERVRGLPRSRGARRRPDHRPLPEPAEPPRRPREEAPRRPASSTSSRAARGSCRPTRPRSCPEDRWRVVLYLRQLQGRARRPTSAASARAAACRCPSTRGRWAPAPSAVAVAPRSAVAVRPAAGRGVGRES